MGHLSKKYYIDGSDNLVRINEDGSFTSIGNIESIVAMALSNTNSHTGVTPQSTQNPDKTIVNTVGDPSVKSEIESEAYEMNLMAWLKSNYNWLYLLSLVSLIAAGLICICEDKYGDSGMLGSLSIGAGALAIILPWTFRAFSILWRMVLFLLLSSALVTIICFSPEWLYAAQIGVSFISFISYGIASIKTAKQ